MTRVWLGLSIVLLGCWAGEPLPEREGPAWFQVELLDDAGLEPDAPLPFTIQRDARVRVQAMGPDSQPTAWDGPVVVHVTPGLVDDDSRQLQLTGGVAEATIAVRQAFGPVRLWVSDEAPRDGEALPSYAAGAAPLLYVMKPTIEDLQTPGDPAFLPPGEDPDASPLIKSQVQLRGYDDPFDPRALIVTAVLNDGFYVTDRTEVEAGTGYSAPYTSVFIFSFSRPDGVQVGDRLGQLSGAVSEFVGYTELSFPSWRVESGGHDPGPPRLLDPSRICDDVHMEQWEASIVRVEDLHSDFNRADECGNYEDFGQWPAALVGETCGGGDARINVVNENTVPEFDFPACADNARPEDVPLTYVQGILRHVGPADPPWVIDVRDCLDLPAAVLPEPCTGAPLRLPSGPKKAPHHYYRDIPNCLGWPDSH